MPIEPNAKAKIKFEDNSLVVEKAFQLDGVYHNIVLTDGNRALTKNNLKWASDTQICAEITNLYLGCVKRAMAEDCKLSGPLQNVRFVYKYDPSESEGSLTQMFWTQGGDHPFDARYSIGTGDINHAMALLSQKFSIYDKGKGGAEASSTPKKPSSPATSSSTGSSLIPDWALGSPDTHPPLKVAPPSVKTPPTPPKPKKADVEEESGDSPVKVAPPLKEAEERRVRQQQSLLDQQQAQATQQARLLAGLMGQLRTTIPGWKIGETLANAVLGRSPLLPKK